MTQEQKFNRVIAGANVERYTLLKKGEFAYNKGNSQTYPQGCIFRLQVHDQALVPNVYYCFAPNGEIDLDYYGHVFRAGVLNWQLCRLINSGVRNDGLLNLNADDFFDCVIPYPPFDQQTKIASVLTAYERELELLRDEKEALEDQKRGLMQKLLTGEWRVPLKDGDADQMAEKAAAEVDQ